LLLGHPITVQTASVLRKFGVIMRANTPAPNVKMGLYSDTGSDPRTLVAYLDSSATVTGRNEYTPTSSQLLLPGNYWLMAVFSADNSSVAQEAGAYARCSFPYSYGNPMPQSISGANCSTGSQANYYILVTPP
jgi:hypothetical protein